MRTVFLMALAWGTLVLVSASALAAPDYWDPRLDTLGVCYIEANVPAGTWYWRLVSGAYENENESGGTHHIYYKCLNSSGQPIENQRCWAGWPSANPTAPCPSRPANPDGTVQVFTKGSVDGYWANFAMAGGWCPFWPEGPHGPYGAWVDGASDEIWGMGMPCNLHVNYRYTWQWTQKSGALPPTISRSPTSFIRSVVEGNNLADDTFTVSNSGGGTLNYTISDDAAWLSVSPASGDSVGEADTITIDYSVAGLSPGTHNATITITDPAATNTPQTIAVTVNVSTSGGGGELHYALAYWFEVGGFHNQSCAPNCSSGAGCTGTGNHSAFVHVFDTGGNKLGNIRVEDADNPAKFGITNNDPNDKLGFVEIPLFMSDTPRLTVNDSGLPSDISPEMVENRSPTNGHYSWEMGFIRVPADLNVTFDQTLLGTPNISGTPEQLHAPCTASCAFYDTVPTSWTSDDYCLDSGASTYGQTFVANGNRVVCAKFQPTVGFLQDLRYGVRIRENGPGGAIVGSEAVSRLMKSDEYFTQIVRWPLTGPDAVAVTPGQTYYAEIRRADQPGSINVWYRRTDNYPNGTMFRGGSAVSGQEMIGRVVCATVSGVVPPEINRSPASFSHTVDQGTNPANDVFTVANSGGGTLEYEITDNAAWLSVSPSSGSSTGEADNITIIYATSGLGQGTYNATITIADDDASNAPQTIAVALTVQAATVPGDMDGDGDVAQDDFGAFQACLLGPGVPQNDPACTRAKLDQDVDVDQDDYLIFAGCMSGENVPGDPGCAP